MDPTPIQRALTLANVPEHSVPFMRAMSGAADFIEGDYLFFAADDWLIAIGYPLQGAYDPEAFTRALDAALAHSGRTVNECWAIAPELPPRLASSRTESDAYYTIPADTRPPASLNGPLRKAATLLRVDESREFTAAHRRLWAEFLQRAQLTPQARELFARTPLVLDAPETDLRLLNAWDNQGNLAASLLLDYAPENFTTYLIGAYSRAHYTPHAGDLLFAEMIERAANAGKEYIHLGLGVNDGIRRFKTKWGGKPALPYQAAAWKIRTPAGAAGPSADTPGTNVGRALLDSFLAPAVIQATGEPSRNPGILLADYILPEEQRPYAMLWRLEKAGKVSWIGGTAHAFRYSFASSFRKLFRHVDTVVFEGPLDPQSMASIASRGYSREGAPPRIIELLSEEEIRRLERVVRGPEGPFARFCNMVWQNPADVRRILTEARPWCVFFTLWHAFLERHGWQRSVDLEAWELAHAMGRVVVGMESIDEQIASLESVPMERILRFLRDCNDWKRRMNRNAATYLAGDLQAMMGSSAEFPTRTEQVIGMRDQRFRERMRPYIEKGRCAVFVGTAHMLNLENMLREDGFDVSRVYPTLLHKLRARFR